MLEAPHSSSQKPTQTRGSNISMMVGALRVFSAPFSSKSPYRFTKLPYHWSNQPSMAGLLYPESDLCASSQGTCHCPCCCCAASLKKQEEHSDLEAPPSHALPCSFGRALLPLWQSTKQSMLGDAAERRGGCAEAAGKCVHVYLWVAALRACEAVSRV